MTQVEEHLDQIIAEGYDFHFGEYISRGWKIFSSNAGGFIGYGLIAGIITMIIAIVPLVGSLASIFVSPALVAGIFIVANKIDRGEPTEFGDFWKGFDYIAHLGLASLIGAIIVALTIIPFFALIGISLFSSPSGMLPGEFLETMDHFPIWGFLLLLPAIYLGVAFSWSSLFVVFYDMEFWPALNYSRKIINKNWFIIFAFSLVVGILASMGAFFLMIGLLITIPFMYCTTYAAFADVTDLDNIDEHDLADELIV